MAIGWGKPTIRYVKLEDGQMPATPTWEVTPEIVEDSTSLKTEKGEKLEAKVEGGGNEDVKYKRGKGTLEFRIRIAEGRTMPFEDHVDGIVEGEYAIQVIPENPKVKGYLLERCTFSVDDSFTSAEGGEVLYTAETLVPRDGSNQIKRQVITATP